MQLDPLKPCPFCGCDDIGAESTATDGSVWCLGCRARITCKHWQRDDRGQTDAIAAWNRRIPSPEPTEAEVEAALRWLGEHIAELRNYPNSYADDIWGLEQVQSALASRRSRPAEAKAGMVDRDKLADAISRAGAPPGPPDGPIRALPPNHFERVRAYKQADAVLSILSALEPVAEAKAERPRYDLDELLKGHDPAANHGDVWAEPVAEAKAEPVAIPDGWVLVPREPTKAMIEAGLKKNSTNPHPWCPAVYRAMIAAAPSLSPERKDQSNG